MAKKSVINPGIYHLGFSFDFPPYQNEHYIEDSEIKQMRWKTSVIMNRRAYVGNVKITEYDGSVSTLSDSVFKSRTNKFDSFTRTRRIDVAVGDGEDIIALAGFADMLLQFKGTTLHIINCAGASEFLEGTYRFKGVDNEASVCSTDYGIVWANRHGAYYFDGREVKDIFDKRGVRRIHPDTWTAFVGTQIIRAGFIPDDKVVIFANDDGDTFLYDMVTQSFTQGIERLATTDKTNFINGWDGRLLIGSNDGSDDMNVKPVGANAQAGTTKYSLVTRAVDGSSPTQDKKWRSVYITFRYAGTNLVQLEYKGVNKAGEVDWTPMHLDGALNKFGHTTPYNYVDADWKTVRFPIGVNQYVMQLRISPVTSATIPKEFEINDITLVYRDKSVK